MTWKKNLNACLGAAVLACSGTVAHAAGWTHVDNRTFTEDATGLMWDQCTAHSRTEFCSWGSIEGFDSYKKFSPDEALSWATKSNTDGHYGYSNWCVPNFSTLKNLYANTQNSFPGYPGAVWLMTSTPAPVGAYQVISNQTAYGNSSESVRLVRSTVYFGPSAACDVRVSAAIPTISAVGTPTNNLVVSLTNGGRGTGYWLAVGDGKRVPTAAEVRAGVDYDTIDNLLTVDGSATVSAGSSPTNISVRKWALTIPLPHVYFVLEDSQGNLSSVIGPMANSSLLLQTINFDTPNDTRVGTDVVLRATATSGKTVNLTSATPGVCSVDAGGVAKALQSGICTVDAKLPNDGTYSAAPKVSHSFTFLPKSDQSISFAAAPALQVGVAGTLSATGGASGRPVTFSTSSAACSLSGSNNGTVTALAAGNCVVRADQAGDANYNAASPATQTITLGKGNQSINFGVAPTLQVGAAGTLSATGGASGNPVTFSTSSAACSLSGSNNGTVTALAAGNCVVRADQAGDANYNAASPATQTAFITNAAPTASAVATSGTAQVGVQLTGSYTYADAENNPQGTSTLRWMVDTQTSGATKTAIAGATSSTYTATAAEQGKHLFFCVTPVASAGTLVGSEVCSSASAAVAAAVVPPANAAPTASAVATSGTAQVGVQLTGSYTYADAENNPQGTSTLRWMVDTQTSGATKTAIAGATSSAYTATAAEQGKHLFFCVTPVASAGTLVGSEVCSGASAAVAEAVVTPTPTPTPIPSASGPVPGLAGGPTLLNMSGGNGAAIAADVARTLEKVALPGLRYTGQTSSGAMVMSMPGGQNVVVAPIAVQANDPRPDGLYPVGNGQYQIVASGVALTVAPVVQNLSQLTGLLPAGASVTMGSNGVLVAKVGGVTYAVQPSVFAQLQANPGGVASLVFGADGYLRFTDAAGNSQTLYPAFAESEALTRTLQSLDGGAAVRIQMDGTAVVRFQGQDFVLVPDLTFGGVPAGQEASYWWQEGPRRYRVRVQSNWFDYLSQGFTVR